MHGSSSVHKTMQSYLVSTRTVDHQIRLVAKRSGEVGGTKHQCITHHLQVDSSGISCTDGDREHESSSCIVGYEGTDQRRRKIYRPKQTSVCESHRIEGEVESAGQVNEIEQNFGRRLTSKSRSFSDGDQEIC